MRSRDRSPASPKALEEVPFCKLQGSHPQLSSFYRSARQFGGRVNRAESALDFYQPGSSSLEALSALMQEGTELDSVASILESFVTFSSSEWGWILQLEVKRSCQKWDLNPRLHSETRNLSTEEGRAP